MPGSSGVLAKASSNETMVAREPRPASTGSNTRGCLVKLHPAKLNEGLLQLPSGRFVIGRDKNCDMPLTDHAVSRMHAAIERDDGAFYVEDLGSTNGTYVNDALVTRQELVAGDLIRVGTHIMKFLCSDHVEAQWYETIYEAMITDGLTGIHNKRYFNESLERELVRSRRHGRPLSLVMFDIDHFKRVNDEHTHLVGDEVLRELCNRIRQEIRKDEVFARYGGEEFAILLPESTADQASAFGERLRRLVGDQPMILGSGTLPVTISVGVGETRGERDMKPPDLVLLADTCLLEAKRRGRNCVVR